jgi:Domain of unknown function (DUF6538)
MEQFASGIEVRSRYAFPYDASTQERFLYLRKAIPKACRPAMGGRKELLISLKTRDPELAKLRWKIVSARVDAMLSAARRGTTSRWRRRWRLTAGLDEEQREAFESYLLMRLEDDDTGDRPHHRARQIIRCCLLHWRSVKLRARHGQDALRVGGCPPAIQDTGV